MDLELNILDHVDTAIITVWLNRNIPTIYQGHCNFRENVYSLSL